MSLLWTLIADYDGGTHVVQVEAEDAQGAVNLFLSSEVDWLPQDFSREKRIPEVVSVVGVRNVWCDSFLVGDKLFLVHVVGTV